MEFQSFTDRLDVVALARLDRDQRAEDARERLGLRLGDEHSVSLTHLDHLEHFQRLHGFTQTAAIDAELGGKLNGYGCRR